MENSTVIVSFVLAAYGQIGPLKYLYFIIIILWYLSIFFANTVLIIVIYVDRRLHEPMYILLCNLFLNEIYGSTSLYPLLLTQMFSDTHEVTRVFCFLQMSCIYTSASVEFCSLAAMAYDRYVSICYPLHYNVIMNTGRVFMIILLIWIYSLVNFAFSFSFIVHLKFCGNVIDKVFCDHHLVIKLGCSVSALTTISDLIFGFMAIVVPFGLISFSYIKILGVCLQTSKETKQKAIRTCTPQIFSVSNLFVGCIFHFLDSRLNVAHVPAKVRIILSVYLLLCQPIVTPCMYGLNLPMIRESCKRFLFNRN
ncbi:olfactory receptor 13C8-like [Genypterus blacodes]|uniref:olfactory receptor 13C8-like n=1 Tax=Genypterus blacodes TaxID=154954 RepID=UPI003F768C15